METEVVANKRFQLHQTPFDQDRFGRDVADGLHAPQKWLPPKYFYDERGNRLYEEICALPEYYLYRSELEIFTTYSAEIHAEIANLTLVEFGSGSATKTRHLLRAYERAGRPFLYCPVDISREVLCDAATRLLREYDHIEIQALNADFAGQPEVIEAFQLEKKAVAFFGSTLGNLTRADAQEFVRRTAALLGPDDTFLLGIDLKKSPAILIPAYDDPPGVTAAFNLNLLRRINHELGGRFNLDNFRHLVFYNAERGCIEMHLRSRLPQDVPITAIEESIPFRKDETIHTESSYKYNLGEIRNLGHAANLELCRTWFDSRRYFLVALFRPT
jgi:dimethylhistidine N-methyltransferase